MKTLFRALIMLALSIWLGGLFFFPFLAQIAFSSAPSRQAAGIIVAASLITLHKIGLGCGLLMLVLLMVSKRVTGRPVYPAILFLLIMLALTAASQFIVIPRMESYRIAAGGSISFAPENDTNRIAFEQLHKASVRMEAGVLLSGVGLLIALAWADTGELPSGASRDLI